MQSSSLLTMANDYNSVLCDYSELATRTTERLVMALDALGRRSRFSPHRLGKRIVITERDIEILRWLYRYRYLGQPQLIDLLNPKSSKRFIERLGNLFHETGFINRPTVQHRHFDSRCTPMIYEITKAGISYLESSNALPNRAVTFSLRSSRASNPQFLHTMMIIDALIEIELDVSKIPNQRFVPVDEILTRAPESTRQSRNPLRIPVTLKPSPKYPIIRSRMKTHLIPDGLYGIEYLIDGQKRYRFWALECERTSPHNRSSTSASSRALKEASYAALIQSHAYKSHWGIPNLKLHMVDGKNERTDFLPSSPKSSRRTAS
jgi:hypothetical protein